jgi:exosortase
MLGALSAAWLASLMFAHRSILAVLPESKSVDPIEAFFFDTGTTIPALHLALFGLVLIHRRHAIRSALAGRSAPILGTFIAGFGIFVLGWARSTMQIDLEVDSLVLILAGSGLILGGAPLFERLLLPLALLWLGRPFPPMLTHHLHEWLQQATAVAAEAIIHPFAPVIRMGHILYFDQRYFEVIEGCSGLRLEITLITATLVYLALTSRSRRQSLGVLAIAIALGPVLNILRVLSIMVNPAAEIAQVHSTQGLVFVSLGVVAIASLDRLFERRFWPGTESEMSQGDEASVLGPPARLVFVSALAAISVVVSLYPYERPSRLESAAWALHEIRPQMGRWRRVRALEIDRRFMGSVAFANKLYWEFEREGGTGIARVFAVSDNRRRRDQSSFSPKTRLIGNTSKIIESLEIPTDSPPFIAERSIQKTGSARWLTLHYRINQRSLLEASARWYFALDLRRSIIPDELVTIRIEVRIDEDNPAVALARLTELQDEVATALRRADPRSIRTD